MTLQRDLANLRRTARRLYKHSRRHGTAESYFTLLVRRLGGDPKKAAVQRCNRGLRATTTASATLPVDTADDAIWLLCAKSGLYLTNAELAEMARQEEDTTALAEAVGELIRSWSDTQDSGEQRATIDCLVAGLNSQRRFARKIFPAELMGQSW